jgi:hypothetical protein
MGCEPDQTLSREKLLTEDSRAFVFDSQDDAAQVRVELKTTPTSNCRFQFISESAARTHLDDVIVYTQNHK